MSLEIAHASCANILHAGIGTAMVHLKTALEIIDRSGVPPEVGARLQEVIDALEAVSAPNCISC
jgi:hypothetical protein